MQRVVIGFEETASSFLPCVFGELNSDCQAWQQVPLLVIPVLLHYHYSLRYSVIATE